MNQLQLYINDELVDLADDSPVALTFQINNLAEVKNQQGNTSNQFKLPLTQRNRQILGFPDDVAFTTSLPYDNYQARIIQDGLEIVPAGLAVLNSVDNDTAAITVLSGNVDFFDALDVKIYDMGDSTTTTGARKAFEQYMHTWKVASVVNSQTNTDGWIWPVVDYGLIPADFVNNPQIDVRYMRPGFFLKTAIDKFVALAGYKVNPDSFLLKQPMYEKLIVQFAGDSFEHGTDYQKSPDEQGVLATLGRNFQASHPNTHKATGIIPFVNVVNNKNGNYNPSTGVYTATSVVKVNMTLKIPSFYFHGRLSSDYKSNVEIRLFFHDPINGDTDLTATQFDLTDAILDQPINYANITGSKKTTELVTLSAPAELVPGCQLMVVYVFQGYTGSDFSMPANCELSITADNHDVLYGQQVQCERIFPDITQKDLLKDTLQRFGIICQTDNTNRMVTFSSFRDIVENIPRALNWTGKCLDQGKTVTFQLGNYAQINNLLYKEDEGIFPQKFGNSQIKIADKTLPLNADLFESQFAATLNRPYLNGSIAQILKVDTRDDPETIDFSISTQPRILINEHYDLKQYSKQITFTDGAVTRVYNDVISVPYFYKSGGTHSLQWEDLRLKYYPELEKILQQTKKVERYFMLTPRDILELDLLIPIYLEQDSAYYYINKIDSWRKGQPVKVELVKLG
ncbi:hypothetical protein GWR56_11210 [Mucilaginibacter sp. 14171R-50]|uniref:hypothetical protein n=1 Tax=Mucilaginibacter sp. 14171R-50 TaxID=2703789 RepID=UPI00138B8888|nr:hypothetical protein [Mucilaginibacter sp. 14171R-50]QHS56074.1 hypothetical protein GWR56_11210 [Mucilaginibacter sp. 14171R-50]